MSNRNAGGRISGEAVASLGSLEAEVMLSVWGVGRAASRHEVHEALLRRRRDRGLEPASLSTVSTVLKRMTDKGLIRIVVGPGDLVGASGDPVGTPGHPSGLSGRERRVTHYEATVGLEAMTARIMDNVTRMLLGRPLHWLIADASGGAGDGCLGRLLAASEGLTEAEVDGDGTGGGELAGAS